MLSVLKCHCQNWTEKYLGCLVRGPCSSGSKVKSMSHIWGVQGGYLDEMTESYSFEHHANLLNFTITKTR